MEVEFRKTGDRRYAVAIILPGRPTLEMNPAPGYDARMPHDLIHFVVERELGIRLGIFGQLAAGGTAGTFHPTSGAVVPGRDAARQRRALVKRGAKLLRQGRADAAKSERATEVCARAWLTRSADGEFSVPDEVPYAAAEIVRVCDTLDELSAAWAKLAIGQALTLYWPVTGVEERRLSAVRPNKSLARSGGGVFRN
jgi:hypothetical protein